MKESLYILLLIFISCSAERKIQRQQVEANWDSLQIWGFKDIDDLRKTYQKEFVVYDFHPNEIIADIGAGRGKIEVALNILYDSLTIYTEDIDSIRLMKIPHAIAYSEKFRSSPSHNSIIPILGTYTKTTLPPNTFDKIIVRETFHHFSQPDSMLNDIYRIMKKEGKLFVFEFNVRKTHLHEETDNQKYYYYNPKDLILIFEKYHFKFQKQSSLRTPTGDYARKMIYVFTKE